jgi:type IV pilus assembly protein PilB
MVAPTSDTASVAMSEPGDWAVSEDPAGSRQRIGSVLLRRGWLDAAQLARALDEQRASGERFGQILVEQGVITTSQLAEALAERLGYAFVDVAGRDIDVRTVHMISEELARRYEALPLEQHADELVVAMTDPTDVFALDDLRMLVGGTITPVMADPVAIRSAIDRAWSHAEIQSSLGDATLALESTPSEVAQLTAAAEDAPIIRLANALLDQAVEARASDIHIEPGAARLRFRSRIDGILHDTGDATLQIHRALVSRFKVMAGIDIANSRVPHDGRFTLARRDREIDVRVSTLPTVRGEAVVLRLLDRRAAAQRLDALGFLPHELACYETIFARSQGAVLVAGPTGSGKTSTLYATLALLNRPDRHLVTVEDPVEYELEGVKQVQVNVRAGVTFAGALRAILRADPDVVLVGEIRDRDTARTAAEAALTGHLVFSTVHTLSGASTPIRLIDMGVDPYLVASAITGVVSQRLVRVLCDACKVADEHAAERLAAAGLADRDPTGLMRAAGCARCASTGYRGRSAVYEILPISDPIASLVLQGAPAREIERNAAADGVEALADAAFRRVASGLTSLDEYVRVLR